MRFLTFILLLLPFFVAAQVTTKKDSTGLYLVTKTVQDNGTIITAEMPVQDSAELSARLFATAINYYSRIAQLEREIMSIRRDANDLRLNISNYFTKTQTLFEPSLLGEYTYIRENTRTDVTINKNQAGNIIVRTGQTRGTWRFYSDLYADVRDYFTTGNPPVTVDVFLTRAQNGWVGTLDGKRIILKRK